LKDAIDVMFDWRKSKSSLFSKPEIFSYATAEQLKRDRLQELLSVGKKLLPAEKKQKAYVTWNLVPTQPRSHKGNRLRLVEHTYLDDNIVLPTIPVGFWDELQKKQDGEFPPVLVIDDLGSLFRHSKLDCEKILNSIVAEKTLRNTCYDEERDELDLKEKELKKAENIEEKTAIQKKIDECEKEILRLCHEDFVGMLEALMYQLEQSSKRIKTTPHKDSLQPVIILSATGYIPDLTEHGDDVGGIWDFLSKTPELRRRCIILLDVHDLREEIPINTGLSWERTAQDTVVALERSPKLMKLLQFGHVIVRFGLTGAMLITNDESNDPTYWLFFDPEHNDADWMDEKKDGVVRGTASVMIATIIEKLHDMCSARIGTPMLSDLRQVLDAALPLSITRMQKHFCLGYGEVKKDPGFSEPFSHHVFEDLVALTEEEHDVLLHKDKERNDLLSTAGHQIQCTQVQRAKMGGWSILAGSTQASGDEVAKSIVLHGTKNAINSVRDPISRFVNSCYRIATKEITLLIEEKKKKGEEMPLRFSHYIEVLENLSESFKQARKIAKNDQRFLGPSFVKEISAISKMAIEDSIGIESFEKVEKSLEDATQSDRETILKALNKLMKDDGRADDPISIQKECVKEVKKGQRLCLEICDHIRSMGASEDILNQFVELDYVGIVGEKDADKNITSSLSEVRDATKKLWQVLSDKKKLWQMLSEEEPDTRELNFSKKEFEIIHEIEKSLNKIIGGGYLNPEILIKSEIRNALERQITHCAIAAPVFRLGEDSDSKKLDSRLVVVDRKVIEGIRSVKRMIEEYLKEEDTKQPLSIAVFGPPGVGKSLAVKKIIEELRNKRDKKKEIVDTDCNLSELSSKKELDAVFQKVLSTNSEKTIPVVFFDEFDSECEKQSLGWLRFFLAPMADGKHQGEDFPKSIFVFAGGTSSTFEEFSLAGRTESDPQWAPFRKAKGPDFVSRLRGHLNVVGINSSGADDDTYLIRRAVVIRALLAKQQSCEDGEKANVDDEMLHAFLHVPKYKHGARSVQTLLKMCTGRNGKVSMSAVPPIHQLDMQVDNGQAFVKLIAEYRA